MFFVDVALPVLFSSLAEVFRALFYLCLFYVASRIVAFTFQDVFKSYCDRKLEMLIRLHEAIDEEIEPVTHLKPVK